MPDDSYAIRFPPGSIFDGVTGEARAMLINELEWFSLAGGDVLWKEGDPPGGVCLVLTGLLGLIYSSISSEEPFAHIGAGQVVGALAMLFERPQIGTVVALRDTSIAYLTKEGFEKLMLAHPLSIVPLIRQMVNLLEQATAYSAAAVSVPKTVAIIPLQARESIDWLTQSLCKSLTEGGRKVAVLDSTAGHAIEQRYYNIETAHDLVLYIADADKTPWTQMCIRRSDRALLVGEAHASPKDCSPVLDEIHRIPWRIAELVLMHRREKSSATSAAAWLDLIKVPFHNHVRHGSDRDVARLTRMLTGRSVGLVLSGGGARGFAHIGVIKALRAAGVPIDLVGGTSMGAVVAAGVALDWDDAQMREHMYAGFVASKPLEDYVFPLVALTRGRKVDEGLKRHFGYGLVEDTWLPFFACASNLHTGRVAVMRRGILWETLRASIAIPGLLPPVIRDGDVMVDGAIMDNLPCDIMRGLRRGPVLAVDVTRYGGTPFAGTNDGGAFRRMMTGSSYGGPGLVSLLLRSGTVGGDAQAKSSHANADCVLEPHLGGITLRDWDEFDRAIELGYSHTMEHIETVMPLVRGET